MLSGCFQNPATSMYYHENLLSLLSTLHMLLLFGLCLKEIESAYSTATIAVLYI